ncbi:MAG: F0F1 ATP synthase subunit delta [Candidatus Magasanikbacteria bacterium]
MPKKKTTTTQYAKALYELTKDLKGEKLHIILAEFVKILARAHKLKQAERVIAEFVKYAKKEQGIVSLDVVTARGMSDKELIKIGDVFSSQGEVTPIVDKDIIGGVVVKSDEVIFDASVKRQLARLKQKLS